MKLKEEDYINIKTEAYLFLMKRNSRTFFKALNSIYEQLEPIAKNKPVGFTNYDQLFNLIIDSSIDNDEKEKYIIRISTWLYPNDKEIISAINNNGLCKLEESIKDLNITKEALIYKLSEYKLYNLERLINTGAFNQALINQKSKLVESNEKISEALKDPETLKQIAYNLYSGKRK